MVDPTCIGALLELVPWKTIPVMWAVTFDNAAKSAAVGAENASWNVAKLVTE